MPIEFCFSFDGEETDHEFLELGERSGLYPDYSGGKLLYYSIGCTPQDRGIVEFFDGGAIMEIVGDATSMLQEDLPKPIARVFVDKHNPLHSQEVTSGGVTAELIVRHVGSEAIRAGGDVLNIPDALVHRN